MKFATLAIILSLISCSSPSKKGNWGRDAIFPIKSERIKEALFKNAKSVHFWAPLTTAGIIYCSNSDKKISDWASSKHPIYGNDRNATTYSKGFHETLKYEAYATILLTPSWNEKKNWDHYLWNKTKGTLVVYASYSEARAFNNEIRKFTFRERPNKVDFESLPSGHATTASAGRTLSEKNLDHVDMDPQLRSAISVINTSMAFGTGWERVEGKSHYPTDLLVGYSFGYFISGFIYDAFMNLEPHEHLAIYPLGGKWVASYQLVF
jgi:hypothetical protein